ncbi:hypothetical protein GBZ48_21690 [Azospirillum melinis]|uniref:Uncharacterized protein n=1 Tax=Azospirillum melinis TaxID=328839 RepID=A0ABX2KPU0_9PROT|nr:hypothetical protein [Azospirillum melinis]MBP2309372.1 hypothetical protein [Azospirillum melinis]NUB01869.1 hypothetical protein [Azospirillum melinis]
MVGEFLSLLSCLLNVLAGGQREMTFSAASYELAAFGATPRARRWGARRVAVVNWLNRHVTGETNHCRKAWEAHLAFWRERMALGAPPA